MTDEGAAEWPPDCDQPSLRTNVGDKPLSSSAVPKSPEPERDSAGPSAPAWIHLAGGSVTSRAGFAPGLGARGYRTRLHPSPEALVAVAPWLEPGCIVLDLAGPVWSAVEVLYQLRAAAPDHPVVVCGSGNVALAVAAMKLGAANVLDRPVGWTALAAAVRDALDARAHGAPSLPPSAAAKAKVASLTPRQRDVLRGVLAGRSNKLIARELGVSARTVECHRATIMMRTGAGCLSDLVRIGVTAGL